MYVGNRAFLYQIFPRRTNSQNNHSLAFILHLLNLPQQQKRRHARNSSNDATQRGKGGWSREYFLFLIVSLQRLVRSQVGLTWPGGTRRNLEKEKVDRGSEVRLGSLFVVFVIIFSQKCAVVSTRCARRRRPCGQRGARPGAAPVDDSAASDRTTRRRRRDDDASAGDDDAFA